MPQKSLPRLPERIEIARKTLVIENFHIHPLNVLLIDDAIGSGATLNELARALKQRYVVKTCHAFAMVGSYKGFDDISTA